jgi:hypothetical protein
MKDTIISRITEAFPELEPTVILVVLIMFLIIILIWAVLWFFVPFWVFGMWRRIRNIERLIRQQVEGRHPDYFRPQPKKRPLSKAEKNAGTQDIDEETKKILDEIGYGKKVREDKEN